MQKIISRSIYNLKLDTICMCNIPFDRSILQLSNGIRHVMPSTDRKLELTAKASMAQPVAQPAVCSNGLNQVWLLSHNTLVNTDHFWSMYTVQSKGQKHFVFELHAFVFCRVPRFSSYL
jgi:hypothetical protein